MEVSLSFDNAVVNASVLKTWDAFWQKLFLGVGIIIAVFGMRLLFPLVIVAQAADMGLMDVWHLALNDPKQYSAHLTNHHAEVAAFGGMFLLLVFLNFLLLDDEQRNALAGQRREEARLAGQGVLDLGDDCTGHPDGKPSGLVEEAQKMVVLMAGLWGILIYVGVDAISSLLEKEEAGSNVGDMVKKAVSAPSCTWKCSMLRSASTA